MATKKSPKIYSVSRLKLYEYCPLRYRYQYIDQIETEVQYIESFVGCRVHETLEYLYQQLSQGELPPVSQVVLFYRNRWEQTWNRNICILREQGREQYRRYGEKCVRRYYTRYYPFDEPGVTTVGVEWYFRVSLDPEDLYQMQGYIDRLSCKDGRVYIVHDYKTGQHVPGRQQLAKDLQPGVYQLAVTSTFPKAREVWVRWHYLALRREVRPTRTPERLEQLRHELIERIDEIENTSDYVPRPSSACRWCEYSLICPAVQEQYDDPCRSENNRVARRKPNYS